MNTQLALTHVQIPRPNVPRFFTVTYNRTRIPTRNPVTRQEYHRFLTMWGTVYPPTEDYPGAIVLQNGVFFHTLDEVRAHFERMGNYGIADEDGNEL